MTCFHRCHKALIDMILDVAKTRIYIGVIALHTHRAIETSHDKIGHDLKIPFPLRINNVLRSSRNWCESTRKNHYKCRQRHRPRSTIHVSRQLRIEKEKDPNGASARRESVPAQQQSVEVFTIRVQTALLRCVCSFDACKISVPMLRAY